MLAGTGGPFFKAAYHPLDLLRRDAGGHIDRSPVLHQPVEVIGEGFPVGLDAVALSVLEPIFFEDGAFQRRHGLALADNIQGHSLAHFTFGIAVGDDGLITVSVHVDVAGAHNKAFGRNGPLAGLGIDLTDANDLAVANSDVGVEPRVARPIDYLPSMNDNIEFSHFASSLESLLPL